MSASPAHVLFVFLDGVGLGPAGEDNPFATLDLPAFARLGGAAWTEALPVREEEAWVVRSLDARLGVEGLPQSGTGQAALFTGINAPALAGRHYGPYPHSKTRDALAAHNIFARVQALAPADAEPVAFANAYPPRFFRYAAERDRWTVTTRACLDADVRIRTQDDLVRGEALTADLTGDAWHRLLDLDVPLLSERTAGARLAALAARHRFTLYEFYLTDKAGHSRDSARAAHVLHALDRFFDGLLDALTPGTLLVVSSDHGNLEDLAVKSHTLHPVPLVARGPGAWAFREATSLLDVTPGIVAALSGTAGEPGGATPRTRRSVR